MVSDKTISLLHLKNLGMRVGDRWLFRKLNLKVRPGSFVAVVGPSGVGKTSLLNCLAGIKEPTEGKVIYRNGSGGPIQWKRMRQKIGLIFQHFNLTENTPVLTNVMCGRLSRLSWLRTFYRFPDNFRREAYAILHDLGLGELSYRWIAEISGGEKQRVAIARALFQQPSIYLADEPVSQLDTYLTGRVLGILKLQSRQSGKMVFCVLHQPELVNRFADYTLSLSPQHPKRWHLRTINPA